MMQQPGARCFPRALLDWHRMAASDHAARSKLLKPLPAEAVGAGEAVGAVRKVRDGIQLHAHAHSGPAHPQPAASPRPCVRHRAASGHFWQPQPPCCNPHGLGLLIPVPLAVNASLLTTCIRHRHPLPVPASHSVAAPSGLSHHVLLPQGRALVGCNMSRCAPVRTAASSLHGFACNRRTSHPQGACKPGAHAGHPVTAQSKQVTATPAHMLPVGVWAIDVLHVESCKACWGVGSARACRLYERLTRPTAARRCMRVPPQGVLGSTYWGLHSQPARERVWAIDALTAGSKALCMCAAARRRASDRRRKVLHASTTPGKPGKHP